MLRAALYPRVSTEEQAKFGLSIHDQQNDLEEYAKANKMKIVGIYPDAGFFARKKIEKRPAMQSISSLSPSSTDGFAISANIIRYKKFWKRTMCHGKPSTRITTHPPQRGV